MSPKRAGRHRLPAGPSGFLAWVMAGVWSTPRRRRSNALAAAPAPSPEKRICVRRSRSELTSGVEDRSIFYCLLVEFTITQRR